MSARGCDAHGGASAEVRALAELVAEALEPWAQRLRHTADQPEGQPGAEAPSTCTWCPVCAVVGLLRGQRPELAARLAEHGVGLLAALRELLAAQAEQAGHSEPAAGGKEAGGDRRSGAQHVPVRRAGRGGGGGC